MAACGARAAITKQNSRRWRALARSQRLGGGRLSERSGESLQRSRLLAEGVSANC